MTAEIVLETGGRRYGGWKRISVSRSIEAFAGNFRFTASEKSPTDPLARPIRMGDSAVVRVGDEVVITGFIDTIEPAYDSESHEIAFGGQSKTGDLVHCSATDEPGEWHGRKLEQIAADLVRPYGIRVRTEVPTGVAFPTFKREPSETVHGAIARAAAQRAVLVTNNGAGDLVLTRVGPERVGVELRRGERILRAKAKFSDRDRFSVYTVRGQRRSSDSDGDDPQVSVSGEAKDLGVTRFRPLELLAEEPGSAGDLQARAKWEAANRQGKAQRATVTVQDWVHPGGIWLPNLRVPVDDSWIGIRREMLIAGVTWLLDENGRLTELSIAPPEAFDLLEVAEISEASGQIWR